MRPNRVLSHSLTLLGGFVSVRRMLKDDSTAEAQKRGFEIARQLIAEEREKQTGFLDLGMLGLTDLPEELASLTHLRRLNLGSWYRAEKNEFCQSKNGLKSNSFAQLPDCLLALRGLAHVFLNSVMFGNLTNISRLVNVQSLSVSGTQVSNLMPIVGLVTLKSLNVSGTQVSDLAPLKGLVALESLDVSGTQVSDLTPLKGLVALQSLVVSWSKVSDLTPIEELVAFAVTCRFLVKGERFDAAQRACGVAVTCRFLVKGERFDAAQRACGVAVSRRLRDPSQRFDAAQRACGHCSLSTFTGPKSAI